MAINADTLRRQQEASVIRLGGGQRPVGTQRRRYATRDELIDLLADAVSDVASPRSFVDHLAALGVDVDALVKITVREG